MTLSACRTIGPAADARKIADATATTSRNGAPATTVIKASPPPVAALETSPNAGTYIDGSTPPSTPDVPATSAGAAAATSPASPSADGGGTNATSPGASPTSPTDLGASTPTTPQPRKLVVKNPWLVVGRPYLVDITAPNGTSKGLTGYQLIFRTRGDFRGVRAGTPLADDRHYKVGKIQLPELPGYVPSGQVNLRLGDRNKSNGRYCWLATVAKLGTGNPLVFAPRANGSALAVTFDLYRGQLQQRTAPVFVRTRSGAQPSDLQDKLGCHLNYF